MGEDGEIIRDEVGGDVSFQPPPGVKPWSWVEKGPGAGRFALQRDGRPFQASAGELREFRTLESFRNECLPLWTEPMAGPARQAALRSLDYVAHLVLDLTRQLHAAGWGWGMLSPESALVHGSGAAMTLFACDLGFAYRSADEFGLPPAWLSPNTPSAGRWGRLWGGKAPMLAIAGAAGGDGFDPAEDLRKVARLFDWLLSGVPRSQPPASADEDPTTTAPVWGVLLEVHEGKLASAEALHKAIRRDPLSRHFETPSGSQSPPDGPRPWKINGLLAAVVAVLLLVGVGGGLWWRSRFLGPHGAGTETQPTGPTGPVDPVSWVSLMSQTPQVKSRPAQGLPPDSRLVQLEQEYQKQPEDQIDKRVAILVAIYRTAPSDRPEVARLEAEYLVYLRGDLLQRVDRRMQQQIIRSEEHYQDLLDAVSEVRRVEQALLQLERLPAPSSTREQEKSCLSYCQEWLAGRD